jgi:hypothetical protein
LWDRTGGYLLDASMQYVHAVQADPDPDAKIGVDANLQGFAPFVGDTELDVIFELHSRNNLTKYQSGTAACSAECVVSARVRFARGRPT